MHATDEKVLRLAGSDRLAPALEAVGPGTGPGLVFDASAAEPVDWDALDAILTEAFLACQEAMTERQRIVMVLHEPSLYGHTGELRSALAAGLLGGARSLAVEGRRHDIAVNAVATGEEDLVQVAGTIAWLLSQDGLSGQLICCGTVHLGRPPG
jgi:NAD(P)-dependent dehydrogenase (short-subunit alcohol dehydrogenase family)